MLIPLVNEFFQKHLSENAVIEHSSNESFTHQKDNSEQERLVKRITDALVRVDGGKYHFECESKNDGEILIRIAEYDMQIALNDAIYNNHCVTMELPDTAVIFLRNHHSLPTYGNITYVKGADTLSHNIPYFEVGKYDLDDLAAKHLYILFPFYLMRYEHAIRNNTESKFAQVENEAYRVYDELTKAYNSRVLSQKEYEDIITLCNDVVKEISKDSQLKERLVEIMGNEIFKTAEERGEDIILTAMDLIDEGYTTIEELVEHNIPKSAAEKIVNRYKQKQKCI